MNYLIIQACNYYELADKEKWTSPLLTALRENQELPTTTSGKTTRPANPDEASNYQAIETLIDFETKKVRCMQEAWLAAVDSETKTNPGNLDLKGTMEMIRSDASFKKSRL